MKLVQFMDTQSSAQRLGLVDGDVVIDLTGAGGPDPFTMSTT